MNEVAQRPIDVAIDRVQRVYRTWRRDTSVAQMRCDWEALFGMEAKPLQTQRISAGGVDALWVLADTRDAGLLTEAAHVLVYFHGGGYKLGSTRSHLDLMLRIARSASCRVLGVDYRLAPEHCFPAPVEDAVAAYEWLLSVGVAAPSIAFAGDSAGGGLAAAALLALRDRQRPLPTALVMMSAWTDLTAAGASYETRAAADPIHQRPMILNAARQYLGQAGNAQHPFASPLYGDLSGLPRMLLQVGDRETVLDDSTRFAAKARAAGVEVTLEVYPDMIHVFQQFTDILPDAEQAICSIGCFLSGAWGESSREASQ